MAKLQDTTSSVHNIKGVWVVFYKGRMIKGATWNEKGPALATLQLLEDGVATLTDDGFMKYDPEKIK